MSSHRTIIQDIVTDVSFGVWVRFMVFNTILNNISGISWQSVLLVEETGVPGEPPPPPEHKSMIEQVSYSFPRKYK